MQLSTGNARVWCAAILSFVLLSPAALGQELWFSASPQWETALEPLAVPEVPTVAVHAYDASAIRLTVSTPGAGLRPLQSDAGAFVELHWPDAALAGDIGTPALPVVRRVFVAPPGAAVMVTALEGPAVVLDLRQAGLPARVMPAQAPVPKLPGALENAPFSFDQSAYDRKGSVFRQRAVVEEAGVMRGQHLYVLEVRPVDYDPAAGTVTLYTKIDVTLTFEGGRAPDPAVMPLPGLQHMLLNPAPSAALGRSGGNYLIIVTNTFETEIATFAAAKQAQGFNVTTHSVADGTSNSVIKSYIESLWGTADQPEYVLLVGDTNLIPNWIGGGVGNPATDLPYACMDGATDWYPDISLGRFPARTSAHLTAMVDKTLYYENGPLADQDYLMRAVFMASEDNYTVSEGTHNYVINNYMNPNGYTSDKLYCHTYNATTQQVRDAFNDGRFFGIYSGHGDTYYWADGPVFSQSDVNNLTNQEMYPFVFSFSCITGTYTVSECFVETWIRAPMKGAVCIYGSSVNSYWTEDDVLERRLFDVIFDESDAVEATVGPVWLETLLRYRTQMGSGSTTRRYYEMYNLMGDPTLRFPNNYGPQPPLVYDMSLEIPPNTPLTIELAAGDDGQPDPPGALDYIITSLPGNGSISDPGGGSIASAPYTLANHGNQVVYTPVFNYLGPDAFTFMVDDGGVPPEGGESAEATVSIEVGGPSPLYQTMLDEDPGWSCEGQWAFGVPTGGGSHDGDPNSGHTGDNVYGYNLDGDYPDGMPQHFLTAGPFDCSGATDVELRFWRWLGVEWPFDHAHVAVSNNGTDWTTVWTSAATISDSSWNQMVLDISAAADDQPTVYVRWCMGTSDGSNTYPGWNID
ncbi:MAG: hypothetical protein JSU68_02310, partial [Phycisphaerales bacterium]